MTPPESNLPPVDGDGRNNANAGQAGGAPRPSPSPNPQPRLYDSPAPKAPLTHPPSPDPAASQAASTSGVGASAVARQILLVEQPQRSRESLQACGTPGRPVRVIHVPTLAEASGYLAHHTVDLAIVQPELADGSGLRFIRGLSGGRTPTAAVVLSEAADLRVATDAMRAGACDLIVRSPDGTPGEPAELRPRLDAAFHRRDQAAAQARRVDRLRRLCRHLNASRNDISGQVDILCNDLVTAYQELAEQVSATTDADDLVERLDGELDLEQVLRSTLEFLVEKAGPSNAAIFLPATLDEFSLGGYVNYDVGADAADMLLDHLADVVAPKLAGLAGEEDFVHFTENAQLEAWFGGDAAYLADTEVMAVPCCTTPADAEDEAECLAVLVLFRDRDQPFSDAALSATSGMGRPLAEALEEVIHCHHRMALHQDPAEADESYLDFGDFGADEDDEALPF